MITEKITKLITQSLSALNIDISDIEIIVECSNNLENGDYTSNIAMRLASKEKKNPQELADNIVENIEKSWEIDRVEVVKPGFINFFLSNNYLQKELKNILDLGGVEYLKNTSKEGKKILVEYTNTNPFKHMHLGHLYTNTVGEAFSRLQEATGAKVKRANYQGDVGLHVAKTMWGIEKMLEEQNKLFEDLEKLSLYDRVKFLGEAYRLGGEYYDEKEDRDAIKRIRDYNYYIYQLSYPSIPKKEFKEFYSMGVETWYTKGRMWCLDYFETIYEKVGTEFDYYFFEGEVGEDGYKMVLENTGDVFKKDDGAIIYQGDPEKGLHTRVFINKEGLPTYEGKELGLAKNKWMKDSWNESITVTGKEQEAYFKVVFDALSKLQPKIANASKHIPNGILSLSNMKKMSGRKGEVISAIEFIEEVKNSVLELMREGDRSYEDDIEYLAEKIAIAAIKYSFLRVSVGKNIVFDIENDIKFDGETGSYLMYVYTRALSIIKECDTRFDSSICLEGCPDNPITKELNRQISKSKGIVFTSSTNYSPNTLCSYLFELGQTFNKFYQEVNVLKADPDDQKFLLALVESTAEIMNAGLSLLGIITVNSM